MNTPTELYENHVHIKQHKHQNIPLLVKTSTTTTTTNMPNNYYSENKNDGDDDDSTTSSNTNNITNGRISHFPFPNNHEEFTEEKVAEEECEKKNKNLAKLNWWFTPFTPTTINHKTIEAIISSTATTTTTTSHDEQLIKQQQQQQQQQQEQQEQEAKIDETTNLLIAIPKTTITIIPAKEKMPIIINNRKDKAKHQLHEDDVDISENLLQQQQDAIDSPIRINKNHNADGAIKLTTTINIKNNHNDCHDINTKDFDDDNNDRNSLFNENTNNNVNVNDFNGLLNAGDEDEMQITGYHRSILRTTLCWLGIILTGGLLRLILYWWQHFYLSATHVKCSLKIAQKVLIQENYNDKHKTYYVKNIINLNANNCDNGNYNNVYDNDNNDDKNDKKLELCEKQQQQQLQHNNNNNNNINSQTQIDHFSVHFVGEHFEHMENVRLFNCKQLRYVWHEQQQCFLKVTGLDSSISSAYYHQQHGLTLEEQLARRTIYGNNEITVPYRNILTLLVLETLNPFYIFQAFSVLLWFVYDYYYYACVIVIMTVVGVTMSVRQTKKNQDRLRETVCNTGNALVVSDKGEVNEVKTQLLVPGDIIEIPTMGCIMQCDAILLSGNCILDEAMLTGESIPITKTPLPIRRDVIYDKKEHARHTLFCGTKVIQTRYIGTEKVLAYVINTGNITAKGGLVRSILYPPPVDYKFEQDSYKFIAFLAIIAIIGFAYTLITKILRGVEAVKIVVESLDLITIVVPPALPAAMTVGRVYAQKRLKLNQVYCISPRAINVSGSIDCCCFDKTGTLTEEGLDMWGVVPKSATNQFQIPIRQIERLPANNFLFGMVTCHSITIMNGKMMGDPLDLKMFESTGWIMEDVTDIPDSQKYGLLQPTIVRPPTDSIKQQIDIEDTISTTIVTRQTSIDDLLADIGLLNGERKNDHGIIREFPFSSGLQRMSVITRRLSELNFNVYCKGSPEMLQQLCRPDTLPTNYNEHLASFAKQGYRIIALGYKSLNAKINYTKVQRLPREQVECDLEFLGFVILENRLKPDTTHAISVLRAANLRTIMITGDNMLTALSVARDCGIVNDTETVITVNVRKNVKDNYELYYTMESGSPVNNHNGISATTNGTLSQLDQLDATSLNSHTTLTMLPESNSYSSMPTSYTEIWLPEDPPENNQTATTSTTKSSNSNYRFALTGDTWLIVREHFSMQMPRFLTRGVIFARMSPEQKQSLVQELQAIDYCVSMCGDGANDCGALKVAHTGISLSETESSIASPFTSKIATIAAVPRVIKEGRAALVTSFGIFKYMATYSMIQFVSVMILYSIDANFSDTQYLYIDLGLISIFAFFFSKTTAYEGPLSKQVPLTSLIALAPLTSLILHLLTIVVFQVTAWFIVRAQPWYTPFEPSAGIEFKCYENYALYAVSSFQYIIMAFVYSKGAPYRRAIWTNIPFCLSIIINLIILIYLLAFTNTWLANFFQLMIPNSQTFCYYVLIYGAIMFIIHNIIETFIVEYLVMKKFYQKWSNNMKNSNKKYMQIEYNLKYELKNWPPLTDQHYYYNNQQEQLHVETLSPTYIELSAEPQHKTDILDNPALNSFFDIQQQQQQNINNTHI